MAYVYSALQCTSEGTESIWVQEYFPLLALVFFLQFEANTKGATKKNSLLINWEAHLQLGDLT